jgi:hypothetical protein
MALLLDTSSHALPEDGYLTDGTHLYCVLGQLAEGSVYELEDCKTLEVVLIAASDLVGLGLRHVQAGHL